MASDNTYALRSFNASSNVASLEAHAASCPADDDDGWEIARLLASPGFRACACGSGIHWARCGPENSNYCG